MESKWRWNVADLGLWGTDVVLCARLLAFADSFAAETPSGVHSGQWALVGRFPGSSYEIMGYFPRPGPNPNFPYGLNVEAD